MNKFPFLFKRSIYLVFLPSLFAISSTTLGSDLVFVQVNWTIARSYHHEENGEELIQVLAK